MTVEESVIGVVDTIEADHAIGELRFVDYKNQTTSTPGAPGNSGGQHAEAGAGTPSSTMIGKIRSVFFSYSEAPSETMR